MQHFKSLENILEMHFKIVFNKSEIVLNIPSFTEISLLISNESIESSQQFELLETSTIP